MIRHGIGRLGGLEEAAPIAWPGMNAGDVLTRGGAMGCGEEPVMSSAVLVATAFRLRDEAGLVSALRVLADAVAGWENRSDAVADG